MRCLIDDGRSGATHSLERGHEFSVGCPRGMRQTAVGSYNEPQDGERATALDRGCNDRPEPLETTRAQADHPRCARRLPEISATARWRARRRSQGRAKSAANHAAERQPWYWLCSIEAERSAEQPVK